MADHPHRAQGVELAPGTSEPQLDPSALVSRLLLEHPDRADEHVYDGAILFADISGFTSLTEALSTRGLEGVEVLNRLLNAYLSPLISTLTGHQGYLINLAGDGVTALFHDEVPGGDPPAVRALHCAQAMQELTRGFSDLPTPIGPVTLSIKVAVALGQVHTGMVGSPITGMSFICYGDPLVAAADLEHFAQPGQILLEPAVLAALDGATTEPVAGAPGVRLTHLAPRTISVPPAPPRLAREEDVRPHIHPTVLPYLKPGSEAFLCSIRPVTAMFIGFDDFKHLGEQRHRALAEYFCQVQEIIDRYRGFLLSFDAGDKGNKLIALFGAPVAVEQGESRALECALDLQELASHQDFPRGQRIGVATGHLYTGLAGGEGQLRYTALGDSMNLAARLMTKAPHGEVLVDQRTFASSSPDFRWGEPKLEQFKGKEVRVPIRRLEGRTRAEVARPNRRGRGLVGRDQEQRLIRERIEAMLAGRGHTLLITGEAGIGKSRLLEPLIAHATDNLGLHTFLGRCADYNQGTAYAPWWPVLSWLFGLTPRDPEADAKVRERVATLCPEHAERYGLMGTLVGVNLAVPDLLAGLPPGERQALAEEMIVDLLHAALGDRPTVLVFDDIHWMDSSSSSLLVRMARLSQHRPVLIAAAMRPPTDPTASEVFKGLSSLSHTTTLAIQPLRLDDVERYACRRLSCRSLGPEVLQVLFDSSQGNPLILEELCDLLTQSGQVEVLRGCARLTLKQDQLTVPSSVHGLILARLERLSFQTRICLNVASVLGRTFTVEELHAIHPGGASLDQVREAAQEAHQHDVLRVERGGAGDAYFFKHALSRDAIYSSLTFDLRRQLHGRTSSYYESLCTPENRAELVPLIAEHCRRMDDRDRLRRYAREAGRIALDRHLNRVAAGWFLLDADLFCEVGDLVAGGEALALGWAALRNLGDLEEQGKVLERWQHCADQAHSEPMMTRVLGARISYLHRRGRTDEALAEAVRAQELASRLGDRESLAESHFSVSSIYLEMKQLHLAHQALMAARAAMVGWDSATMQVRALYLEGTLLMQEGRQTDAMELFLLALTQARRCQDVHGEALLVGNLGHVNYLAGRFDEGARYFAEATAVAERVGNLRQQARLRFNRSWALMKMGSLDESLAEAERAARLFERTDYLLGLHNTLLALKGLCWMNGRLADVDEVRNRQGAVGRLLAPAQRCEDSMHEGEIALASGDPDDARSHFEAVLEMAADDRLAEWRLAAREGIAESYFLAGDLGRAKASSDAICDGLEGGERLEWPARFWWRRHNLLLALRLGDEARLALLIAARELDQVLERLTDPHARHSLVHGLPWNHQIVTAARLGPSAKATTSPTPTSPPTATPPDPRSVQTRS